MRDALTVDTIRMVRAQIKDAQIATGKELGDAETLAILNNAAKKRREAIEMYEKSSRVDLTEKERKELAIIEAYLPKQLSRTQIEDIVAGIIAEVGASSTKDLGRVMGVAMQNLRGQADGKLVQDVVKNKLS